MRELVEKIRWQLANGNRCDRAAALDDHTLPPELQVVLDRCRDDLAVIRAATDADVARLLHEADAVVSFEVLRGLVRRH